MKIYTNIKDLPLWNYQRMTIDLRYLIYLSDYSFLPEFSETLKANLEKVKEDIQCQIIDVMGVPESIISTLQQEKDLVLMKYEVIMNENYSLIGIVKKKEKELESKGEIQQQDKYNLSDEIVRIEQFMKFQIDEKKTNVEKYYGYVKLLAEHIKRENEQIENLKNNQ